VRKWEYRTLYIRYERKKVKDWIIEVAGRPPLVGLETILNTYGAQGWELVSLDLADSQVYPTFGLWHVEPEGYRATFKRPTGDGDRPL
jgi:hypothetical protein